MAKIMMAFQVLPKVEDERLFEVVDEAIAVVAASGVTYEVGPMETTMEGEPDQLWAIIRQAQDACIKAGASRVMTYIKMDYNPGKTTIEEKIKKYREK
ncbi:hypothetical protein Desaci_0251 [Desulfosporosinus acidiphilus SJ4]|uniref:Thiamine-binding protein domain-containing protein n=1 Tax=Desulfosporosinus acidiphilus (strain DSM 22704 / JCM 16185 / SJ4) TaxID=646529 RepID=I4D0K0_DESAJ|nr:thiamine-binding protein [Desulfosporosinus acidiphilus]AFM39324.1 hypothetical protein Desaci_0251 [Desulfosporosinus acidiphilus SJ4]